MRHEVKEFTQKLISLILPITFQQFMLALVSASDALMLGMISQDALSAVSLASRITLEPVHIKIASKIIAKVRFPKYRTSSLS